MSTRIRESVPKKIAITVTGSILVAVGYLWAAGDARAETGISPTQDFRCENLAYVAMHSTDGKCDDTTHPADYGSGPQVIP